MGREEKRASDLVPLSVVTCFESSIPVTNGIRRGDLISNIGDSGIKGEAFISCRQLIIEYFHLSNVY